jgi:hypothetical protein
MLVWNTYHVCGRFFGLDNLVFGAERVQFKVAVVDKIEHFHSRNIYGQFSLHFSNLVVLQRVTTLRNITGSLTHVIVVDEL